MSEFILDFHVSPDPGHPGRNWWWWLHGEVEFMNDFPGLSESLKLLQKDVGIILAVKLIIFSLKNSMRSLGSLFLLWNLKSHKILEHSCNFLLLSRFSNLSFGLQCISVFLYIIHQTLALGPPVNQVHTFPSDSLLGIQGTSAILKTLYCELPSECLVFGEDWSLFQFFDISPKIQPRETESAKIYIIKTKVILKSSYLVLKGGSDGKASACSAGDLGLIPGLGRSPGEGNGNLL